MKYFLLTLFTLLTPLCFGQDNFVPGYVTTAKGQRIEGLINDQYWTISPSSVQFKDGAGLLNTYMPAELLEFGVGEKMRYKSFQIKYDSSANLKDLSRQFLPEYKQAHLFLKVVLLSNASLLKLEESRASHFFILKGNHIEELINHVFSSIDNGIESKRVNPTYIEQLKILMADCKSMTVSNFVSYSEKSLTKLFLEYNSCMGSTESEMYAKEKAIVKIGIIGTMAFDKMRKGFDGGVGYGVGMFVNFMLPHNLYKVSVYNELIFRKFGDQFVTRDRGSFVLNSRYTEQFNINSIKATTLFRNRIGSSKNSFIEAGLTYSLGLKDDFLYEDGFFVRKAQEALPTWGFVFGAGLFLTKNVIADFRYERGSGTNFNDTTYTTTSSGYSTAALSILYQF